MKDRERKEETIMTLLEVKNVRKIYTTRFGGNQVEALHNVNFSVEHVIFWKIGNFAAFFS